MAQQFESGGPDNKALAAVLCYLKDKRLKVGTYVYFVGLLVKGRAAIKTTRAIKCFWCL